METQVMGSKPWVESVFKSPPARGVKGRSRPTQRYVTTVDGMPSYAEGGNTAVARNLLHTMRNAGLVSRFKLEPFKLEVGDLMTFPDVMFQTSDGQVYVVEVKSYRYLTTERLEKCLQTEKVINASGMKFLLWTDRWPLNRHCWGLTRRLKMMGAADITKPELQYAEELVKAQKLTMDQFASLGVYDHVVMAAAWFGRLHFNLFSPMNGETTVSSSVSDRRFEPALTANVGQQTFWKNLKKY